jgi:prophage regulatory protein
MVQRVFRLSDVEKFAGLKRSALYDGISKGTFPRPIRLGKRAVGWLEEDLQAWQAAQIDKRDRAGRH